MPEYDYQCKLCNTEFAIIKHMLESVSVYCPKCRSIHVKRIFGKPSIVYRGKGFYTTDSREPLTPEE